MQVAPLSVVGVTCSKSRSSSGLGLRPFTAATGVRTPYGTPLAGIAQLVEHNLAKVGVASSSLVSRSNLKSLVIDEAFLFPPSTGMRIGLQIGIFWWIRVFG